jgi:DTW domain-containing protein YfiP
MTRSEAATTDKPAPATALDFVRDRLVKLEPTTRVVILQHPQEQDMLLGSAKLLEASLKNCVIRVGLSWASLTHAIGDESLAPDPTRWAVMYRGSLARKLRTAELAQPFLLLDKKALPLGADRTAVEGIIVLDGTWSQAKALWWRNAWMLKLMRVILHPTNPSAYGKIRKQPSNHHVSTLEAVALALDGLGEKPEISEQLQKLFRTMCQRARDAGISNRTEPDAPRAEQLAEAVAEGKPLPRNMRQKNRKRRNDVAF